MFTTWISSMIEAAVIRGFTNALNKLGMNGAAGNEAAHAELAAMMGSSPAIEAKPSDETTAAIETKPAGRRGRSA